MKQLLQYQILMDSTEEIKLQTIHHQASPVTAHCGDLATVVAGRALASAHADETMSTIKDWLRVCLQEHHDCNANPFHSVRHYMPPPRLIKISADGTSAHLVEAAELDVPYIASSYCWGAQKIVTVTGSNRDAFQRRLPTEQLPRTIQQAIETTYRIGYITYGSIQSVREGPDGHDQSHHRSVIFFRDPSSHRLPLSKGDNVPRGP